MDKVELEDLKDYVVKSMISINEHLFEIRVRIDKTEEISKILKEHESNPNIETWETLDNIKKILGVI